MNQQPQQKSSSYNQISLKQINCMSPLDQQNIIKMINDQSNMIQTIQIKEQCSFQNQLESGKQNRQSKQQSEELKAIRKVKKDVLNQKQKLIYLQNKLDLKANTFQAQQLRLKARQLKFSLKQKTINQKLAAIKEQIQRILTKIQYLQKSEIREELKAILQRKQLYQYKIEQKPQYQVIQNEDEQEISLQIISELSKRNIIISANKIIFPKNHQEQDNDEKQDNIEKQDLSQSAKFNKFIFDQLGKQKNNVQIDEILKNIGQSTPTTIKIITQPEQIQLIMKFVRKMITKQQNQNTINIIRSFNSHYLQQNKQNTQQDIKQSRQFQLNLQLINSIQQQIDQQLALRKSTYQQVQNQIQTLSSQKLQMISSVSQNKYRCYDLSVIQEESEYSQRTSSPTVIKISKDNIQSIQKFNWAVQPVTSEVIYKQLNYKDQNNKELQPFTQKSQNQSQYIKIDQKTHNKYVPFENTFKQINKQNQQQRIVYLKHPAKDILKFNKNVKQGKKRGWNKKYKGLKQQIVPIQSQKLNKCIKRKSSIIDKIDIINEQNVISFTQIQQTRLISAQYYFPSHPLTIYNKKHQKSIYKYKWFSFN